MINVSGFGNIALVKGGTSDVGFKYDLSKKALFDTWSINNASNFGIQANTSLNPNTDLVTQVVIQDQLDNDLNKSITWAFVRYQLSDQITARLGRIATPTYLLSEYLHVSFAYMWTLPIPSFYATVPNSSINGGDIAITIPSSDYDTEFKVFGGQTTLTSENISTNYDIVLSPILGTKLSIQYQDWLFAFAGSTGKVRKGNPANEITSQLNNPALTSAWPALVTLPEELALPGSNIGYYSLGIAYEGQHWSLQSELSYTDMDWALFPDFAAGYVSLGYSVANTTNFAYLAKTKSLGDAYQIGSPPTGALSNPLIQQTYAVLQKSFQSRVIDQESIGVGFRFYVNPNVAIKGQVGRTWLNDNKIGGWLPTQNGILSSPPRFIDNYSVSISYVF